MSGWLGLAFLLVAGALGLRAHGRWRRAKAQGFAPFPTHDSLAALAEAVPPMIYMSLAIAGLGITAGFVGTGGGGFSVLDLAGFLALLAAFGADIGTRVHCRPRSQM